MTLECKLYVFLASNPFIVILGNEYLKERDMKT